MASSIHKLSDFISYVTSYGVARPTRFEVVMAAPQRLFRKLNLNYLTLVSLYCENASLPQLNLGIMPQRIYGPNYQNPISIDYGGEGVTLSFLMDRDFDVKKFFEEWIGTIVDPVTYNLSYLRDSEGGYAADITINQLNEVDDIVYSIKLIDAFPRNIGIMDLNAASLNMPQKVNVTFVYRRWIKLK